MKPSHLCCLFIMHLTGHKSDTHYVVKLKRLASLGDIGAIKRDVCDAVVR